jgi:hypothetical protein
VLDDSLDELVTSSDDSEALDSVDEDSDVKDELTVVQAVKTSNPKARKYGMFFFIWSPCK